MAFHVYRDDNGQRVPGVTTVLDRFKESGGLVHWAWQMGLDGKSIHEVREEAADGGTLAHKMVERFLHGLDPFAVEARTPEIFDAASRAFEAFTKWADQTKLKVLATEVRLVSTKLGYGGTLDANIVEVNGERCIGDWKAANKIYPEHLLQVAGYTQLWDEANPTEKITGGAYIVRFSKADEGDESHRDFEQRYFGDLEEPKQLFNLYLQAFQLDKKIRKRVR